MTDPVTSYAEREHAGRDGLGRPGAAQDPAAFGGLPEILNQSPRVQAQLQLDRTLNQGTVQRFRDKRTDQQKKVEDLADSEINLYYGLLLTNQLEIEGTEENALIGRFLDVVAGGDNDEPQVEQQEAFALPQIILGPLDKIAAAPLTKANQAIIGNSRAKKIYLFDGNGDPTAKKADAAYMVDTGMDQTEFDNYGLASSMGVRVPQVYGRTKDGYPIVQWLPRQTTAGGAGGKPPLVAVKQKMKLDAMLNKPFPTEKWQRTLADVKNMIDRNYTSKDLQFMIDDDTGEAYIMDLEANNAPVIGSSPDRRLLELADFLEKSIQLGGAAQ